MSRLSDTRERDSDDEAINLGNFDNSSENFFTHSVQNLFTPPSDTLSTETPRQRTRGATIRLSATIRKMTRTQIVNKLKSTSVNTTIKITFATAPMWHEKEEFATIIACTSNGDRLIHLGGQVERVPFTDTNRVITEITIVKQAILNVVIQKSNGTMSPDNPTIYVDGGCRPNPGAGGAAIVYCNAVGSSLAHSKFYPLATFTTFTTFAKD